MNIKYTDNVKQWVEGYPLVQQATNRLKEVLGESAGLVTGEWDRTEDEKGRAVATLRLRDPNGEVVRKFTPDELRSPAQTAFGLYQLWGRLIQAVGVVNYLADSGVFAAL